MKAKSASGEGKLQLAPGHRVRIDRRAGSAVLATPAGPVPLNETAAAILSLCNGTRTRDEIVTLVTPGADAAVAGDVCAFIAVAGRSGWILER
jgi:coenzyme PQQ biosynthesis protein PqqD